MSNKLSKSVVVLGAAAGAVSAWLRCCPSCCCCPAAGVANESGAAEREDEANERQREHAALAAAGAGRERGAARDSVWTLVRSMLIVCRVRRGEVEQESLASSLASSRDVPCIFATGNTPPRML